MPDWKAFQKFHLVEEQYANDREFQMRLGTRKDNFNGPNHFIVIQNKRDEWAQQFNGREGQEVDIEAFVFTYNKNGNDWAWDGAAKNQRVRVQVGPEGKPIHVVRV